MTKAKKWKIAIIVLLGFVATVLIAIGEGRFWKYQQNYIPDGTYQMLKYEAKSAYSNELINWTERGENNDSLYEDFIVVENMKSQFYYVFVGDGEPFVSPFEHDEKLPCATVVVCLVNCIAVPHRITVLCLQFLDAAVYIIVCTAHVVVPTVTLTCKLQAALLPDVIECKRGLSYESLPLVCTATNLVEAIQGKCIGIVTHLYLCLCINQIDVC